MKTKNKDFFSIEVITKPFENKGIIFKQNDTKEFATFSKYGLHFNVFSFDVNGYGKASIIFMKGFFGLMKMRSFVFTPLNVDAPLASFDFVEVLNKKTVLMECYKTTINEVNSKPFVDLKNKYKDLEDVKEKKRWYESLRVPGTFSKVGKKKDAKLNQIDDDFFEVYIDYLLKADKCDYEQKRIKSEMFTTALLNNGGPAVDFIKKAIGEEKRNLLVSKYIFGTSK